MYVFECLNVRHTTKLFIYTFIAMRCLSNTHWLPRCNLLRVYKHVKGVLIGVATILNVI